MTTKQSWSAVCAAALCTLLLALTACTNESDRPLDFADDALLSGADIGAADLSGVKLIGDIAIVATTQFSGGRLAAIDLKSGQTIWSADDGDPILGGDSAVVDLSSPHDAAPPVVRDLGTGDFEVLVPYRTVAHIESGESEEPVSLGVASLSGDDGRADWLSEPLITDDDQAERLMARPVLTAGDTVVAAAAKRGKSGSLKTWAIDEESGNTRWTKDDVWPTALGAGTVVVEPSTDVDLLHTDDGPEWTENTAPSAVDAQDGKQVWDLSDRFDSARVTAAAGDYAVVHADGTSDTDGPSGSSSPGSDGPLTQLITIDDGSAAEDLENLADCAASSTMIACDQDGELTTISASGGTPETSTPYGSGSEANDWKILDVFADTVVVKDETGDNDRVQALDREGKVRAEDVTGIPQAMNDDYLVSCAEERAKCGFHSTDSDQGFDRPTSASTQPLTLGDPLPSSVPESSGFREADLSDVTGVALADESVIINGEGDEDDAPMTTVVDADTAKPIWSIDQSTDLRTESGQRVAPKFKTFGAPHVIDTDTGFSLLTRATSEGRGGIASLNGKTGDLESFHSLGDPDTDTDADAVIGTTVVSRTHAALELSDDDSQRIVLVDYSAPTKPKTVWTQDGYEPVHLGEESALVRKTSGAGAERKLEDVRLLGLGKSKDVIWDSHDVREDEHPGTVMLEAGMLIVNWNDGAEVFDASNGTSLGAIGKRLSQCRADGGTVLCASTPDPDSQRLGSPIVLERSDSGVDVSEVRNRVVNGVSGALDGRFFVDAAAGAISIDGRGTVVDSDLTGRFHNASDDGYALFMTCPPNVCVTNPSWDIRRID